MVECRFCQESRDEVLEEHHVVPRRYGGSDHSENLITVCSNCHSVLEKIYDDSFYRRLGVESGEVVEYTHTVDNIDLDQMDIEERVEFLRESVESGEDLVSRRLVMSMVADSLGEAAHKTSNGRVYDAENESVRQEWAKQVGYLARAYSELL